MTFKTDAQRKACFFQLNFNRNRMSVFSKRNAPIAVSESKTEFYIEPKILKGVDKKDLKFFKFSIGDIKGRLGRIERSLNSSDINEVQREELLKEKKKLELELLYESKMSVHPKEIGSVWEGEEFIHGPRIRDPNDFIFIKTVMPDEKYYHFAGSDKIPKLPKGSKLVVGKLKKGDDWAIQSTLIPKSSNLGKSLIKKVKK